MDNVEYSLPYGWKKVGIKRKKKHKYSCQNWDFYVWSPCGKKFRSSCEIDEFLADNPKVKCDKELTNNKRPEDFKTPTKEKKYNCSSKSKGTLEDAGDNRTTSERKRKLPNNSIENENSESISLQNQLWAAKIMVQKENLHLKEEKLYEIPCSDIKITTERKRKQSEKEYSEIISEIHKGEISENEEEIPQPCNYCDKEFESRNAVNYHKKIVHGIEKPFSCKFCDKLFKLKHHLDSHERTHTTEKPFSCDLCEKSYTQGHSLQLHKKKLHGIIQVILYKSSSKLSLLNTKYVVHHTLELLWQYRLWS